MKREDWIDLTFEFPERLWKRPIEFHNGKPRLRVAASSYSQETPYQAFGDEPTAPRADVDRNPSPNQNDPDETDRSSAGEPRVNVTTEAGNAKVTVELASVKKEDLKLNCAEDSVTLSVRTAAGPWTKEIHLPFRVDPDTAKAAFKNGKLELIVRRHGRFNPPRPVIDWV
jgi:HSP20 family molecular chaperone IbpA